MRKTTVQSSPCHCTNEHLLHTCTTSSRLMKAWLFTCASCFLDLFLPQTKTLSCEQSHKYQTRAQSWPATNETRPAEQCTQCRRYERQREDILATVDVLHASRQQSSCHDTTNASEKRDWQKFNCHVRSTPLLSKILVWRRRDCNTTRADEMMLSPKDYESSREAQITSRLAAPFSAK